MMSLKFFIDIILPATLWPWGWLSLLQKWVPGVFGGGVKAPVRRADNLPTFMYQLSWNLGASTSWNPQGLSRPVTGLLFTFFLYQSSLLRGKAETRNTVWRGMHKPKEADERGMPGDDVNRAVIETVRMFKYNRMSENKII